MRMRHIPVLMGMLLMAISGHAYSVKAIVTDSIGEPESFATYRIYAGKSNDKAVVTAAADINGAVSATLPKSGDYTIVISSVGKKDYSQGFNASAAEPDVDLGTVTMKDSQEMLSEVVVTAQRPLVKKDIDRIGYEVQSDPDAKTSSVIEMLRKVPMVSVDAQNNITVNGSSNFKIFKNGRPNNALSNNAKDILAAIPASMIKRIEVITEPGAKYDAEGIGAILNIVTDEKQSSSGVMGSVDLRSESSEGFIPGADMWLTGQANKVMLSASGGYSHLTKRETHNAGRSETTYLNSGSRLLTESDGSHPGNIGLFGLEGSWDIDSLNLFTAEANAFVYNVKPEGSTTTAMLGADGSELYSYRSRHYYPRQSYFDLDGNFNYQHNFRRKGEMLTASYAVSTTDERRKENQWYEDIRGNFTVPYTESHSDYDLNYIEHTFQIDYTRPFGKVHTLDVGGKYILRRNHSTNDQQYLKPGEYEESGITDFLHITDVGALYAQYSARLGRFSLRGGLRYEFSHLKAESDDQAPFSDNLSDWVPSAAASWQINDANSLTFNYGTRISRPGISYLNPAVISKPTSLSYGNPDLTSSMSHSMKLTWMYIKRTFNANLSANYSFSNDGIAQWVFVDDNDIEHSTYRNMGRTRSLSLSGFMQWSLGSKTSLMVNARVSWNQFQQMGMSLSRWQWGGYMRFSQKLPWKLSLDLDAFRIGMGASNVYTYSKMPGVQSLMWNLGLKRSFLKDDRLTVNVSATNLFGRSKRHMETYTVNGDMRSFSDQYMMNLRRVEVNVNFRFGSLNAQVKKTAASISNDDLEGRKTN